MPREINRAAEGQRLDRFLNDTGRAVAAELRVASDDKPGDAFLTYSQAASKPFYGASFPPMRFVQMLPLMFLVVQVLAFD